MEDQDYLSQLAGETIANVFSGKEIAKAEWDGPYQGERGGEFWVNVETGERRYDPPPGDSGGGGGGEAGGIADDIAEYLGDERVEDASRDALEDMVFEYISGHGEDPEDYGGVEAVADAVEEQFGGGGADETFETIADFVVGNELDDVLSEEQAQELASQVSGASTEDEAFDAITDFVVDNQLESGFSEEDAHELAGELAGDDGDEPPTASADGDSETEGPDTDRDISDMSDDELEEFRDYLFDQHEAYREARRSDGGRGTDTQMDQGMKDTLETLREVDQEMQRRTSDSNPYRDDYDPDPRSQAPEFDSAEDLQENVDQYQERLDEAVPEGYTMGDVRLPEEGMEDYMYNAFNDVMEAGGDEMVQILQEAVHDGSFRDDIYNSYEDIMEDLELAVEVLE